MGDYDDDPPDFIMRNIYSMSKYTDMLYKKYKSEYQTFRLPKLKKSFDDVYFKTHSKRNYDKQNYKSEYKAYKKLIDSKVYIKLEF